MQKVKTRQSISIILAVIMAFAFAIMPNFSIKASATDDPVTLQLFEQADSKGTAITLDSTKNKLDSAKKYVLALTFAENSSITAANYTVAVESDLGSFATSAIGADWDAVKSATPAGTDDKDVDALDVSAGAVTKYIAFSFTGSVNESDKKDITIAITNDDDDDAAVASLTVKGVYTAENPAAVASAAVSIVKSDGTTDVDSGRLNKNQIYYAKVVYENQATKRSYKVAGTVTPDFGTKFGTAVVSLPETLPTATGTGKVEFGGAGDKASGTAYIPFKVTKDVTTATDFEITLTYGTGTSAITYTDKVTGATSSLEEITSNFTLSDAAFAGINKNSTITVAYTKSGTAEYKNLKAYHKSVKVYETDEDDAVTGVTSYETKYQLCTSSLVLTENGTLVIKGVKFKYLPQGGDVITLENDTVAFTYTVRSTVLGGSNDVLTNAAAKPPVPVITVDKAFGVNAKLTIKGEANSTYNFYDAKTGGVKVATVTLTKASDGKKVSDLTKVTDQDTAFATAVSNGRFYVTQTNAAYGTAESLRVPVYFGISAQTVTPVASVTATNTINLKAKDIVAGWTVKAYVREHGTSGSFYTDATLTGENGLKAGTTGNLTVDVTKLNSEDDTLLAKGKVYDVYFTVKKSDAATSNKTNIVTVSVADAEKSFTPATIIGSNNNVIVKNLPGAADQIVVGALPANAKILVFAVPASDSTHAIATALNDAKINSSAKIGTVNESTITWGAVNPYYTGVSASASANKETTIKTDLSAYVGYDLMIYVASTTNITDATKVCGEFVNKATVANTKFRVASESVTEINLLASQIASGNDTMVIFVGGVIKGDSVSIYNSTTNAVKTVKAADTFAIFTVKHSDGYDMASVARTGYPVQDRVAIN